MRLGKLIILAMPLLEESRKFCIEMPNPANFAFDFPAFLHVYILLMLPGKLFELFCYQFIHWTKQILSSLMPIWVLINPEFLVRLKKKRYKPHFASVFSHHISCKAQPQRQSGQCWLHIDVCCNQINAPPLCARSQSGRIQTNKNTNLDVSSLEVTKTVALNFLDPTRSRAVSPSRITPEFKWTSTIAQIGVWKTCK